MVDEEAAELLAGVSAGADAVEVGNIGIGVMVNADGAGAGFHALRSPITRTSIRRMKRWPYSKKKPPC
jgi:hypothetical protein